MISASGPQVGSHLEKEAAFATRALLRESEVSEPRPLASSNTEICVCVCIRVHACVGVRVCAEKSDKCTPMGRERGGVGEWL